MKKVTFTDDQVKTIIGAFVQLSDKSPGKSSDVLDNAEKLAQLIANSHSSEQSSSRLKMSNGLRSDPISKIGEKVHNGEITDGVISNKDKNQLTIDTIIGTFCVTHRYTPKIGDDGTILRKHSTKQITSDELDDFQIGAKIRIFRAAKKNQTETGIYFKSTSKKKETYRALLYSNKCLDKDLGIMQLDDGQVKKSRKKLSVKYLQIIWDFCKKTPISELSNDKCESKHQEDKIRQKAWAGLVGEIEDKYRNNIINQVTEGAIKKLNDSCRSYRKNDYVTDNGLKIDVKTTTSNSDTFMISLHSHEKHDHDIIYRFYRVDPKKPLENPVFLGWLHWSDVLSAIDHCDKEHPEGKKLLLDIGSFRQDPMPSK